MKAILQSLFLAVICGALIIVIALVSGLVDAVMAAIWGDDPSRGTLHAFEALILDNAVIVFVVVSVSVFILSIADHIRNPNGFGS